jgi:predicted ATPase
MSDQIKLSVKDFRAIKEADIKLNGITVVSGINGSGKSTLSKLLYNGLNSILNYKEIVFQGFNDTFRPIVRFADIVEDELNFVPFAFVYNLDTLSEDNLSKQRKDIKNYFLSIWKKLHEDSVEQARRNRIQNILKDTLINYGSGINTNSKGEFNSDELIDGLMDVLDERFDTLIDTLKNRYSSVIYNSLSVNNTYAINQLYNFSIYEYEIPLISKNSIYTPLIYTVENVAYIESPVFIGASFYENKYWYNLNQFLQRRTTKDDRINNSMNSIISSEIIKGETDIEDMYGAILTKFKYKRNDGNTYDLLEVATGVKSFSILQLLLKNGFLTKNTLLIIDEPEVHLHPQWIVEYARMIVLLNKEIGVKFFIASHSPDMISAIKYISEKEQTTHNLEYYLAEQTKDNPYLFNYKSLGTNIDPIFESFNIALDRINQYGISTESNDLF